MEFKVDYEVDYEPIMQFFAYGHLRDDLQRTLSSSPTWRYAASEIPRNPERSVALRKLLEAKDAGIRAVLYSNGMGNRK